MPETRVSQGGVVGAEIGAADPSDPVGHLPLIKGRTSVVAIS